MHTRSTVCWCARRFRKLDSILATGLAWQSHCNSHWVSKRTSHPAATPGEGSSGPWASAATQRAHRAGELVGQVLDQLPRGTTASTGSNSTVCSRSHHRRRPESPASMCRVRSQSKPVRVARVRKDVFEREGNWLWLARLCTVRNSQVPWPCPHIADTRARRVSGP
jgi:hypothetical protein